MRLVVALWLARVGSALAGDPVADLQRINDVLTEKIDYTGTDRFRAPTSELPWPVVCEALAPSERNLRDRLGVTPFPGFIVLSRDGCLAFQPVAMTPAQIESAIAKELAMPAASK